MINKINLKTIGVDAEMFLQDINTKEIVSAEGYIKGSKYDPFCFNPKNKWYTTQLDNVLAEVTIPPATKMEEFANGLITAIQYVKSVLPPNLVPVAIPAANLDDKYLQTEQSQIFGRSLPF